MSQIKNYFGYSNDHSGSMGNIAQAAMKDYNANIAETKSAAIREGIDTIVSVVECGITRAAVNRFSTTLSSIAALQPLRSYPADGSSTPLYDSVGMIIDQFKAVPDYNDPMVAFMVFVTTDGGDNSSRKWTASSLGEEIRRLQASDKWTFVFRVPRRHADDISRRLGIPRGNVVEWDQTDRGVEELTVQTKSAMSDYYSARTRGITSTQTFYGNDLTKVKPKDIKIKLDDISSQVTIWPVFPKEDGAEIRPFVESRITTPYTKGAAFYELVKTERRVQASKMIVIQDKKTQMIYAGDAARQMLGLPDNQDVRLVPGNHGNYKVFIQSTSVNRKLPMESNVLYWPKFTEF